MSATFTAVVDPAIPARAEHAAIPLMPTHTGHVVAILPRGEAIRNFVHTGTLDTLDRAGELTVLSVLPSDDVLASLSARYPRVRPLEEIPERYPVRILRELLDMAHGRHLWSAAARERWRLRDVEAVTPAQRIKRLGRKLACYPFASRRGVAVLERIERTASRVFSTTDQFQKLYRETRPTLVFNGSHVHSRIAIPAVQAAQWLGIPTATFLFSWDNLTSQGRVMPAYDYYLVWNEDIKRQLLEIYPSVRPEQVFVTGTPQFDFHFHPESYWTREEFCRRVGADPGRPMVLYSTGMAEHMPGEPRIVEQIADMLREMTDLGSPQLLVRVYPKDRTGRFEELQQRRADILFPEAKWVEAWLTPTEDDTRLLTNTLRHVDAGVNVASTVSLELCMFDKPVVNVGYDPPGGEPVRVPYARYYEFDHYRPLVECGAVQLARSPHDMRAMLREALTAPATHRAERRGLMQRMFGNTLDGRSAERVAQVLLQLANRGAPPHA
ncbi:MAG TPA: hypothetical protein VF166_03515 [Gemmatimonadaceae bacterium]